MYSCPYSTDRLHELYWRDKKTISAIALQSSVHRSVVKRWLIQAGITLRTVSEQRKIVSSKPHMKRQAIINLRKNTYYGPGRFKPGHRNNKKTRDAVRRSNIRRGNPIIAPCGWCGGEVKRHPARRKLIKNCFCCSTRCANLVRWRGRQVYTEEDARKALGLD